MMGMGMAGMVRKFFYENEKNRRTTLNLVVRRVRYRADASASDSNGFRRFRASASL